MLKRHLTTVGALLLATLVASISAVSFQRKIESFRPLGFEAVAQAGVFLVADAAPEAGLAPGDVILTAGGHQPRSVDDLRRLLTADRSTELLVQRGEGLLPIVYPRLPLAIDIGYLLLAAIGLLYLLIGVFCAVKDRQKTSTLFFLWCMASATLFLASARLPPIDLLDRLVFLADLGARLLVPALTLHFFLAFPQPLFRPGRLRRLLPVAYLPALMLAAFQLDQIAFGGRWLFGPASAAQLARVDRLELIFFVAAGLGAAVLLFLRLHGGEWQGTERIAGSWEQRRQSWWIVAGLVGGFVPFTLFYLLPWAFAGTVPTWSMVVGVLPLALVPLAFAWAILKFRLLDLGSILREAAAYGITAVLAIFGFQVVQLAIQSGLGEQTSLVRNLVTFGAGLLVAGVLLPTRGVVAAGIERLQFRGHWGPRRLLGNLGHELLFERDLDRLCDTLVESVSLATQARVNLYLAQGQEGLVPFRHEGDLPRAASFELFGDDFWQSEVSSIAAISLPGDRIQPEARLYAAGYRYALPITVRGRRLGFVILGYKLDDEPFAGEDLDLVRGVLNQAALAIENARLLDEIQQQLMQVSRLEAYNKGILESSPAGLAVLDSQRRIVLVNHAFAAIVGRARQQLTGVAIETLLPVRPLPEPADGLIEVSYCEPSGAERFLQLSTALHDAGEGAQQVLVVQDVSEQMALEQNLREKEHLASLGMLAAGVAHEVNTPLTGISSYAQFLLADTPPDDPRYAILKKMERQTFRASEIVNSLLDFARNRRNDTLTRVRFDQVVGETLHLLEERLAGAGVELDWQPPAEPVMVQGNEGELHQVISNLVVNAIDAMSLSSGKDQHGQQSEKRRLTLRLDVGGPAANGLLDATLPVLGERATLTIADTGPGIPPERLDTIFKPFFSSKLGRGGSGLGLAISFNIVRRHGGTLTVRNQPAGERGCTFSVELPRSVQVH